MMCNYLFLKEKINSVLLLIFALLCVAPVLAQTPAWQRVELGAAGNRYPFAIYSSKAWGGDTSRVTSAVIVFHGMGRNGAGYYAAAEKQLQAAGGDPAETLLIAPNFFAPADAKKFPVDGMPLWSNSRWNSGWDADNRPLSSFQVIDDLLVALLDTGRFPRLKRIVLAGHSAGGQIVHRYAVLNQVDEKVRASGKTLQYVIANPSSYTYFTNERPRPNGTGFAPYDKKLCVTYNEYRYGPEQMLPYAKVANGDELFRRYAARDVTYLYGTADNNPNHHQLDKTCGAEAQGANRLERGRNYLRYENYLAGTAVKLNRHSYEVIGVDHAQGRMFGSQCAAALLYGVPQEKNTAGAACRAPQL